MSIFLRIVGFLFAGIGIYALFTGKVFEFGIAIVFMLLLAYRADQMDKDGAANKRDQWSEATDKMNKLLKEQK